MNFDKLKDLILLGDTKLFKKELDIQYSYLTNEDCKNILKFSIEKNCKEIIFLLFNEDRFDLAFSQNISSEDGAWDSFKTACFYSCYEVVQLFFKKNNNIQINENILISSANNMLDDHRIFKHLLGLSKKKNINLNLHYVLEDQATTPHFETINLLFNDDRVNPNFSNNDFFLTFILLYNGEAIEKNKDILKLILNDSRFEFIPYSLKDFEFAYRELENDQYFLYKFLFKIPDFKESLFVYLENNLNIFPEWQHYLDFLIRHRKIENDQNKIINF